MARVAAPSLAYGLMQGLTGYMQGQDRRRSMDMEDEAIARDEARRQQEMAMRQEQMAAQARQMEEARKERERQAQREMQMDRRTAYDRGEQPVEQVRETGGAMMGAGGSGNALADVGVKAMGGMLMQQAKAPAYSIGDTGYVKAMPSVAERAAKMQAEQRAAEQNAERIARAGERAEDRQFTMGENAKNRAATLQGINARMAADQQPKPVVATEGERRASGLLSVAEREDKVMHELGTPGFMSRVAQDVPYGLGRAFMSDKARQFEASAQAFARSYLYTVSGANAPESEIQGLALQILPQPLDDETMIKAKAERRAQMLEGMRMIGGRAAQPKPAPDARNDRPPLDSFMVRR
jgi:hypothetical protein